MISHVNLCYIRFSPPDNPSVNICIPSDDILFELKSKVVMFLRNVTEY